MVLAIITLGWCILSLVSALDFPQSRFDITYTQTQSQNSFWQWDISRKFILSVGVPFDPASPTAMA